MREGQADFFKLAIPAYEYVIGRHTTPIHRIDASKPLSEVLNNAQGIIGEAYENQVA